MSLKPLAFNISLSVLNHLGRNLYRNFITVLGEAISNAWDADANNVYITINKQDQSFSIEDDGIGMDYDDFQDKFLKIGYSKRKDGSQETAKGRPFIGRKGIGKLALLSCAETISVISQKQDCSRVSGMIDNMQLDKAINEDNERYLLSSIPEVLNDFRFKNNISHGTYLCFSQMKAGIINTPEYLKKMIALSFRFAILDSNFNIYVNGDKVTEGDLKELIDNTQIVWDFGRPSKNNSGTKEYLEDKFFNLIKHKERIYSSSLSVPIESGEVTGFIAAVYRPSQLSIRGTDETATIDLFVNGRLREKDILKHKRTRRVAEDYLYGQIHYNTLEDATVDRFTSSREGVQAEDPLFRKFLTEFNKIIPTILNEWDKFRLDAGDDGDGENPKSGIPNVVRKSRELYNATTKDFFNNKKSENKIVAKWLKILEPEASYNFPSYANCFLSENLLRCYITYKQKSLSSSATKEIAERKRVENLAKKEGGVNINLRQNMDDKTYLSLSFLVGEIAHPSEKSQPGSLWAKSKEYKPMRDAMMHTAVLTEEAKIKLQSVYEEIKAKIRSLLENI